MSKFFEVLANEKQEINEILSRNEPMHPLTKKQQRKYNRAQTCMACKDYFVDFNYKVRHHCHVTGKYLGPCCNRCNLSLKYRREKNRYVTPIIAHNGKNYDNNFILKHFDPKKFPVEDIYAIPLNSEKYISFAFDNFRFLDSCQFLAASLENLVSTLLKSGKDKFVHTSRHFPNCDLLLQKGIYPYEHMKSRANFDETEIPPQDAFYSALTEECVDDDEYHRAQKIWENFGCRTMRDYHDLYLATDVLLLADVFENFRELGRKHFNLDPAHYFTLPGYSWDACLKMTGVKLELLQDPTMYLFFENSIRGGIAMISNRYAKANNKYLEDRDDYDPTEPAKYITYLDANNLYGTTFREPLPVGDFKFLSDSEIADFDVTSIPTRGPKGYILEVDLEYPAHLHDLHNDYPLAPEKMTVTSDLLSPYAKSFDRRSAPTSKLVPNLRDKQHYVVHYRNLQLYLSLGLRLAKIHSIMEFTQSSWLCSFVDHCTANRQRASTDAEKDFWKLTVNSVFGKSMENVRKRCNISLVSEPKRALKLSAKPTFKGFKIINEHLGALKMAKGRLVLDKPIYTGFTVLEISKLIMYDFHYNRIIARYGNKAKLLFTDTDSLCYCIQTPDLYRDMEAELDVYDTSNFDPEHPLFSKTNEKVLGKFKSETGSKAPREFVGLRPKMYSLQISKREKPKMTAKGIKRGFVAKHVRHEQFLNTLKTKLPTQANFKAFRSTNHVVRTLDIQKNCLSAFDDKRYLLVDGRQSYAYGHWRIGSEPSCEQYEH